ncbi:hypothetical protein H4696_009207 [Amycolatopsis lexingtonensis]|uniref:Uncharacterized protein n=1 Tax=Amycolatopsis lexingtonensis TaxID=218822 RepID=A0ABR9IFY8_9PSEU|nr:hypothetical protein [Amycolatopsis lexingtonensis]MBE1502107.1 hypothetical protein [Amycolatopsis lexingtonensis]
MTAAAVPAEPQQPAEPAERHLSAVPDPEPETDEREHIVLGYN